MLSLEQGKKLVELARKTVENYLEKGEFKVQKVENKKLKEKRGVFVTIENFSDKSLRGCVGYPHATLPLFEAVQRAAFSSAFEDSRFEPLKKDELEKVIFEVSVLTELKLIRVKSPKEYFEKIEPGKDGLILRNGPFSGLFLPQVWRQLPKVEEFLENLCWKAGLSSDYIYDKRTKIYKFRVQVFLEKEPNGEVFEQKI